MFGYYLTLGFQHVLPGGLDHVLFIVCLFFASNGIREKILLCSVFTLSHSASLALAAYDLIRLSPALIEPLISFTIFVTAVYNILQKQKPFMTYPIIFIFGLIHGLGFASALTEVGVDSRCFAWALLGFNVGVELAQAGMLVVLWLLLEKVFLTRSWYFNRIVYPINLTIACTALYWTLQRSDLI